ncbi:m7GpppN-mRNA hydrolase NUDT17-like [Clavelina lepadiformis]|uniref:m7GpppN-mRNA hydrolase NUDT17-like n=1 Tax=Clavelina lepadiformis TaxID=159417 RepID=UPI00404357B8
MMRQILTYWKSRQSPSPILANFSESVLNIFSSDKSTDEVMVSCSLKDNCLVISDDAEENHVLLKRPSFCPMKHLDHQMVSQLSPNTTKRGVNVGVAVLLESRDNFVLLTRRAQNLRTFPNVWVPPGGHVGLNETLSEAGFREMKEETGISVDHAVNTKILGLWESVFPPNLQTGLPKRHHVVVYLHYQDNRLASEINQTIQLDPAETDRCAWISRCVMKKVIETDTININCSFSKTYEVNSPQTANSKCHFSSDVGMLGAVVQSGTTQMVSDMDHKPLLNQYSSATPQLERVSTGTKFALSLITI